MTTTLSIEQSAIASGCGRGCDCGRGRDFVEGRGSFGGDHHSNGGKQTVGDKGPIQCKYCGRNNHISEKCWEKFGRREWAQLIDTELLPLEILPMLLLLLRLMPIPLTLSL